MIPSAAHAMIPLLLASVVAFWHEAPNPETAAILAAQIEKETCITLTHSKCWSPHAELKTSREYGFGFGQWTKTSTFNRWQEERERNGAFLKDWTWDNRYNPRLQMTALVLMDRHEFAQWSDMMADRHEQWAITLAGINGGLGGARQERLLCGNTAGCDKTKWFDNIELHSRKSRTAASGYGDSFFAINRAYPRSILVKAKEYEPEVASWIR